MEKQDKGRGVGFLTPLLLLLFFRDFTAKERAGCNSGMAHMKRR